MGLFKGLVAGNGTDLGRSAKEGLHLVAKIGCEALLLRSVRLTRVFGRRAEDHVAVRDAVLDVLHGHRLEGYTELVHGDGVATDVDRAEKSDVTRHQPTCVENHQVLPLGSFTPPRRSG